METTQSAIAHPHKHLSSSYPSGLETAAREMGESAATLSSSYPSGLETTGCGKSVCAQIEVLILPKWFGNTG
ncbi:MAG: hypothetical protein ACLFSZ_00355, partial [Puniceicoccaceae bacterium]